MQASLHRCAWPSLNLVAPVVQSEEPAVAEKAKDVLRSAVRSLSTINNVHNVEQCAKFTEFYMRVLKTALLAQMLKEMTER